MTSLVAVTAPDSSVAPGPMVTAPVVDFVVPVEPEKSTLPDPVTVSEEVKSAAPVVVVAPSPRTCGHGS